MNHTIDHNAQKQGQGVALNRRLSLCTKCKQRKPQKDSKYLINKYGNKRFICADCARP